MRKLSLCHYFYITVRPASHPPKEGEGRTTTHAPTRVQRAHAAHAQPAALCARLVGRGAADEGEERERAHLLCARPGGA